MSDLLQGADVELAGMTLVGASIRLGLAALAGAIIGIDREWRSRPAGLRTHMLICVAAALFSIIALELVKSPLVDDDRLRVDPLRVLEAITAGVAFLAAGTIIINKGNVRGLTTGASMWLAAGVGVCCGFGYLRLAGVAMGIAVVILVVLKVLAVKIGSDDDGLEELKGDADAEGDLHTAGDRTDRTDG